MYNDFYNLDAEPFGLSPDPRFCFYHQSFRKARSFIRYAIHRSEGFVIVTGDPGTGKTTLIKEFLDDIKTTQLLVKRLFITQLNVGDILPAVVRSFGLACENSNKALLVERLQCYLATQKQLGRNALLIVDEAQDLSADALEELRLLTNMEAYNQPLLQMILVGQRQLLDIIHTDNMEQLRQRIIAAYNMEPMNSIEIQDYIVYRLEKIGWKNDPKFDSQVFSIISQCSAGLPRRINQICSRLLLHGFVENKHELFIEDMHHIIDELRDERLLPLDLLEIRDSETDNKIVKMNS